MAQNDPFAAIGGGVQLPGGGWVPKNHPLAKQYLQQQQQQQNQAAQPVAMTIPQQAQRAQTYSATPGAAPSPYTTNQGVQDVVRNTYLQRATQGTTIDRNDPNFRQQADAYAANVERARRNYLSEAAERMGPYATGALQGEARMAAERAGQAAGAFEAQLVARELENRRDEILDALTSLRGMLSADEAAALQRELADTEAAIKRESLAQSGSLGRADLALRDKLGTGALNIDLLRALLQNQQFGQQEARAWAQFDWNTSPMNPANWI